MSLLSEAETMAGEDSKGTVLSPDGPHPLLPETVKICGHIWKVGLLHPSVKRLQQHDGLCDPESHEIGILGGMPDTRTGEVFLHEIIEALDSLFALDMPHNTVQVLAVGLFQVLIDNDLLHPDFLGLVEEERILN
jgi:hypothetical protein